MKEKETEHIDAVYKKYGILKKPAIKHNNNALNI